MHFTDTQVLGWVTSYLWVFVRIAALVMIAPVFSAGLVPVRVRMLLAVGLTIAVAPLTPTPPNVDAISLMGFLILIHEFVIGLAMGFVIQIVFDAMVVGGQTIAMSMGLGFATMVDPQRGVNVPLVSQYFLVLTTLLFLSLNGHLLVIEALVQSFHNLPIGQGGIGARGLWSIVLWSGQMFAGALQIALPAVIALMVVNLAFGVMSRAAPTLNLFAVGFPITMTLGFTITMLGLSSLTENLRRLLEQAFGVIGRALTGA